MKCQVCGSEQDHPVFDALEMMRGLREVHRYFLCRVCGCLQIMEVPFDMARYYDVGYYSFRAAGATGLKAWLISARDRYAALQQGALGALLCRVHPTRQFDFLQPIRAAIDTNSRVLDVGCGAGALLRSMRSAGFLKVSGIDPFISRDIYLGERLLVRRGTVNDVTGTFDLVMFHHSFEHMPDQNASLQRAFDLLSPGGHCIVRVPLVSSFAWREYGVNWVQLDAPRHFYLHSTESLKLLARRTGFDCTAVRYDSTAFQFWGSEQYLRGVALQDENSYAVNPARSSFSAADIAAFAERANQLNATAQGDQAAFYLRKPSH